MTSSTVAPGAKARSPWDCSSRPTVKLSNVASIILGGGRGARLFPLTASRSKPGTPFGGRYCLIDVPISNSINSHIDKIFVLTQFLSSSLAKHIHRSFRFDSLASGFIEILAPEEKPSGRSWYQGTADAVRQNIEILREVPVDYFLILSGDQLYHMDYQDMLAFASSVDADVVVASRTVSRDDATRMGILNIDAKARITRFIEKPQDPALLDSLKLPENLSQDFSSNDQYLASMGIYLFKRDVLLDLLAQDSREDFGKHLIPTQVEKGKAFAFLHEGYWEDIGTISAFYKANLALTKENPAFDCHDEKHPIHSYIPCLPGPKIRDCHLESAIISSGCIINAKEIHHSILGPRTHVGTGTVIHDSYIMGNDFFRSPSHYVSHLPDTFEIGENCVIKRTIMDKNVRLGRGVQLVNREGLQHYDGDKVYIRDGIIVVAKGADLPDGFTL